MNVVRELLLVNVILAVSVSVVCVIFSETSR